MMVVMAAYVVSRKLGHPIPGSFHFSEQAMIVVFVLPLAAVAFKKGHIQFELFIRRASLKTQERLELLNHTIGIVIFGATAWWAWKIGFRSLAIGEYTLGEIDFPIYPFRLILALGMSVFALQLAILLIRGVAREVRRKREVVSPEEAPPLAEVTKEII
jgi:TRAP-type C4-dicarboxylate transport system permease small subunit